jgi:hypothetical protein
MQTDGQRERQRQERDAKYFQLFQWSQNEETLAHMHERNVEAISTTPQENHRCRNEPIVTPSPYLVHLEPMQMASGRVMRIEQGRRDTKEKTENKPYKTQFVAPGMCHSHPDNPSFPTPTESVVSKPVYINRLSSRSSRL